MTPRHLVLRAVAVLLAPAILLFALYVQFHADYSPGGGFQAGVVFAASLILHALIFGAGAARNLIAMEHLRRAMAAGVLLYGLTGAAGMTLGGVFLDYAPLAQSAQAGRHVGVFLVELGVGITVAATIVAIFRAFSEHRQDIGQEDW